MWMVQIDFNGTICDIISSWYVKEDDIEWYVICVTWYAKEEELDGSEYAAAHSRIAQLDIPESAEYSV